MIYLDNHATTPLDPHALQAMLPFFQQQFANAGSITHQFGRDVAQRVDAAIASLAHLIGAADDELVITSGATESNNLALFGVMLHPRQKRRKIISVVTEHKAILDPLNRLKSMGFDVQLIPVLSQSSSQPGQVDLDQLRAAIDSETALVSVMWANNEIGVIQPIHAIAQMCREADCLLHTDATQAIGRIPCHVDELDVDLLSFSAHKFYGPKGIGGLFVRRRDRLVRLQPQIVGGGQQLNLRSGTLNTAGVIGMHAALENTLNFLASDSQNIAKMRDRLFELLQPTGLSLNGPALESEWRLGGNLNCCFYPLEGQSLMMHAPELAISSGSACTSANPEPSHVLRSLGLSEDQARSSLRFGTGRFNTMEQIETAAKMVSEAVKQLGSIG
jgi:cysteine desulfurase